MALSHHGGRTPDELVSRSIAPVKAEFWHEVSPTEPSAVKSRISDDPAQRQNASMSKRQRKKVRRSNAHCFRHMPYWRPPVKFLRHRKALP